MVSIEFQSVPKKILLSLFFLIRKSYKFLFSFPNIHGESSSARKKVIKNVPLYLRKTYSDQARLREMRKNIYSGNITLLNRLNTEVKPTILLDFGANIGLSTLSLINQIPSIRTSISVEGEKENFGVLEKNCQEWGKIYKVNFNPVYGIISGFPKMMHLSGVLKSGYSASGTFTFVDIDNSNPPEKDTEGVLSKTPLGLLQEYKATEQIIVCKVDIEGGEEDLFQETQNGLKMWHT